MNMRCNPQMPPLDEIRRQNLARLVQDSSLTDVAKRAKKPARQIGDMIAGRKSFGEKVARAIERELAPQTTPGWLDSMAGDFDADWGPSVVREPAAPYAVNPHNQISDDLIVPVSNAAGSMGFGFHQPQYEQVVDGMRMTKSWVQTRLPSLTSPENLAVLTAYGDSMEPTFSDGDLVLVDRGVREVKLDAVYVLARNDELFIKRVRRQLHDGSLMIQSDNQLFGPGERVEDSDKVSLQVLGRVVWAWKGKKL